jgi:hypothetical protein
MYDVEMKTLDKLGKVTKNLQNQKAPGEDSTS